MIAAVEAVSGKRCEAVTGKPSPWTINIALGKLNVPKEAAIMVGDRLETDMRMGIDAGIATALVLTGITKRTDLAASPIQPTFVLETLRDLL